MILVEYAACPSNMVWKGWVYFAYIFHQTLADLYSFRAAKQYAFKVRDHGWFYMVISNVMVSFLIFYALNEKTIVVLFGRKDGLMAGWLSLWC